MTQDLRAKFESELEECDYSMLAQHLDKDAVIMADDSLDLIEVCLALANDDAHLVKEWSEKEILRRPNMEEMDLWKEDPHKKLAKFIIVQPFVVIQLIRILH